MLISLFSLFGLTLFLNVVETGKIKPFLMQLAREGGTVVSDKCRLQLAGQEPQGAANEISKTKTKTRTLMLLHSLAAKYFLGFLATLVALHFTPVSKSVSQSVSRSFKLA